MKICDKKGEERTIVKQLQENLWREVGCKRTFTNRRGGKKEQAGYIEYREARTQPGIFIEEYRGTNGAQQVESEEWRAMIRYRQVESKALRVANREK